VNLADVMACPACHSTKLRWRNTTVECPGCGRSFEIVNGIPVMLIGAPVPHEAS
jgi:uncharacterized protein YbaR (Trm112 family)